MILDVTVVIVFGVPGAAPVYKMANLIDFVCVLTALPTGPSSVSLPLLGPPSSLRHNNIEIRPINNPTGTSKCSNEKEESRVSHLKSEARGDFPGGPVVRTLRFHCSGQGFNPWLGN